MGGWALDAVRALDAAIVVADWHMPDMDGISLCQAVSELRDAHALRTCFFLLLTAQSDTHSIVRGLEAGADDYLTKPYHKEELLARMRAGQPHQRAAGTAVATPAASWNASILNSRG